MSGWDRAAPGYLAEWQVHFAPYEVDLVAEIGLREGDRVISTAGSEVVALARAVGERGRVHAFDAHDGVLVLCNERIEAAGLAARVVTARERTSFAAEPHDAAVSAFALPFADDPVAHVRTLGEMIVPAGKVGLVVWGPAIDGDPERAFARIVDELHPEIEASAETVSEFGGLDRPAVAGLFERAGLVVVRHTIVTHPIVFLRAERFVMSLLSARTYGPKLARHGEAAIAAVLARFYERVAAEDAPVSYSPAATIVVAAHPGVEVELPHRPSVRVPVG